jgi:hypothetical protein
MYAIVHVRVILVFSMRCNVMHLQIARRGQPPSGQLGLSSASALLVVLRCSDPIHIASMGALGINPLQLHMRGVSFEEPYGLILARLQLEYRQAVDVRIPQQRATTRYEYIHLPKIAYASRFLPSLDKL